MQSIFITKRPGSLIADTELVFMVDRPVLVFIEEKVIVRQSLAEILKEHRTHCKMTQEFVAEAIGVSRQAVSKWENGSADPSTTNLIALSNLYGIPAEELLKNVTRKNEQNHFSEEEMKNKK